MRPMIFCNQGGLMIKEEFYFDSRDGENRIHAVRYTPDDGNVRGIVQIVHGMAEYVERYENLAEFLTKRGILVTGEDHLGHGKSVSEGGSFGYFCEQDPATVVVRDVHRLKKITEEQYPQVPYIILGHSMGSFIARNYLCRYGSGIDGAVIVGTGMQSSGLIFASKAMAGIQKLFCGSKHVSHFIDKAAFGGYNKRIDSPRTSSDWLSRNTDNVDRYIADELCGFTFTVNGFQTLFELIRRLQKQENLEKVPQNLPILMVSGAEDPVGDYGKGVHKACDSLKRAGVKNIIVKLYENDRHELLNEDDAVNGYEIRWAEDKDWIPAMHMIWKTFLKYEAVDYTEEGIRNFHEFITDEHLYKSFRQGRYQMMVALDGARIIGAASVRNYNHLSLLFVDEEYHHRGVGRSLMGRMCEYLKKEAGERYMSLKAAPYAVDFYRKLGFHAVHAEEAFSGIRVTPMEKFL